MEKSVTSHFVQSGWIWSPHCTQIICILCVQYATRHKKQAPASRFRPGGACGSHLWARGRPDCRM